MYHKLTLNPHLSTITQNANYWRWVIKYWLFACLGFVLHSAVCYAQDTTARASSLPHLSFKWSPTSLIEPKPYMQVAIEHKLIDNLYANYELGITPNLSLDEVTYKDSYGARLRFDLRWYLGAKQDKSTFAHFFIAPEVFGKYEQWSREQWVTRDGGAYAELIDVKYKKYVYGGDILMGVKLTPKNSFITVDILGGLGFKTKDITRNLPPATDIWTFSEFFNFNIPGTYPNAVFGVKVGYRVK